MTMFDLIRKKINGRQLTKISSLGKEGLEQELEFLFILIIWGIVLTIVSYIDLESNLYHISISMGFSWILFIIGLWVWMTSLFS